MCPWHPQCTLFCCSGRAPPGPSPCIFACGVCWDRRASSAFHQTHSVPPFILALFPPPPRRLLPGACGRAGAGVTGVHRLAMTGQRPNSSPSLEPGDTHLQTEQQG
ncbi:hypothetical protein AAFF_G00105950 [Aldrovandia affinis]|uniref:Uncharacterized protein n=1 Tax=Aldrovandia affinis TaxID=143900 RepID=A0AAD7T2X3_9TELE|nr:hypothetical protein AAFF_G00105950 [Aldrovandia affinis]